jgi:hypothetical protein
LGPLWKACLSWYSIFVNVSIDADQGHGLNHDGGFKTKTHNCLAQARPHLFAEVIKAIIWLTPDERHFGPQFGGSFDEMWRDLCNRLVTPLPSPVDACSLELIGMELTYPIVANIFARACLFMTVPLKAQPQAPQSQTHNTSNTLLDDLDMLDFTSTATDVAVGGFGYSRVLTDLLMCTSERQIALFPSVKAANALQQIWNFVALFTIPTISANPFTFSTVNKPTVAIRLDHFGGIRSDPPGGSDVQHPLIHKQSVAQEHAQNALFGSLSYMLEADIQPCKAFYREMQTQAVFVTNLHHGSAASTGNSFPQSSVDASTLQVE